MITVTLIFADGREHTTEVDPGSAPYPLTIETLRIPDLMAFVLHPERELQRSVQHMIDMADAETFLERMRCMTDEEKAVEHRERWHTFELMDQETLRYREVM